MPVIYDINPEFDLIIYYCSGTITAAKFFKTADMVTFDPRLKDNMKIIIDFFSAELDLTPSDLRFAVEKNKHMTKAGRMLGRTAIITRSSSLKFMADALKLMSINNLDLGICHNVQDAINFLGLSKSKAEVIQFWETTKRKAVVENL